MLPDSSDPKRLSAPSPCRACVVSKAGWITALVTSLLASLFFFRLLSVNAEVKIQRNSAELAQVEIRALKQQQFAERILAERQISDLTNNNKAEPIIFARLQPTESGANQPFGVLAWLPVRQGGTMFFDGLPATAPEEEYRLWLDDGTTKTSANILVPASGKPGRYDFKTDKPVAAALKFIVTRERKGAAVPTGPVVLTASP